MTFKAFSPAFASASAIALGLAACIFDKHDDHKDRPWDHACEHAADAPVAVTAHAEASEAPSVSIGHTTYAVSFTAGDKVRFTVQEHGEFGVFLTADVPVTLSTASGIVLPFEKSVSPLQGCASLAVMHVTAHLETGTYHLAFGASSETSVGLLLEELEDDH